MTDGCAAGNCGSSIPAGSFALRSGSILFFLRCLESVLEAFIGHATLKVIEMNARMGSAWRGHGVFIRIEVIEVMIRTFAVNWTENSIMPSLIEALQV